MREIKRRFPAKAASVVALTAMCAAAPGLAQDITSKQLVDLIEQQNARIKQLEEQLKKLSTDMHAAKPAVSPAPAPVAAAQAAPSSGGGLKIGKANFSLAGSWLEGVAAYRAHSEMASASGSTVNTVWPNSGLYRSSEFRTDVRGTRLSLTATSDPFGEDELLRGRLQFDWANLASGTGQNNGNWTARLRQAWFTWDKNRAGWHFLAGQNWSLMTPGGNLIAADGGPGSDMGWSMRPGSENVFQQLDAFLPGYIGTRQPQFRVVKDLAPGSAIGVSIENQVATWGGTTAGLTTGALSPIGSGSGSTGSTLPPNGSLSTYSANGYVNTSPLGNAPQVVVKASYQPSSRTLFEAYGVVRNYRNVPSSVTGPSETGTVWSGAGGASTYLKLIPTKLDLSLSASYGSIGGMDSSGAIPDVTTDRNGKPVPVMTFATWTGLFAYPSKDLTLLSYLGYTKGNAAGVSGTNSGYGNPANLNTGCYVLGGVCSGNIDRAMAGELAAIWRVYNGTYGRVEVQPQLTYVYESRFKDNNGIRPSVSNWIFNTAVRYFPF